MTDRKEREAFERLIAAAKAVNALYPLHWDLIDGGAVIFPERVPKFEEAFAALDDALKAIQSPAPIPLSLGDGEDIEALRKDADRYRWIRTEAARFKGKDDAGALRVSVTYRERRSDGDGFTGLLITPRGHDFDAAIDVAMAAGGERG